MNEYEDAVFVSYAWGGESESTVDELERAFAVHGIKIARDKKDIGYKGSIEEFERRLGRGQCVVLVISDKYLRSEHCMYELVQVQENQSIRERVFPIVMADTEIYQPIGRVGYIKYWEEQIENLNQAIKGIGRMTNLADITAELDKYARIRASFDHITKLLSDMNALTLEMHKSEDFATLIAAVEFKTKPKTLQGTSQENPLSRGVSVIIEKIEHMYYNRSLSLDQRNALIALFRKATTPPMEKEETMTPQEMNPEQVHDLYQKSSYTVAYYLNSITEQQATLVHRLPGDPKIEYAVKLLANLQQQILVVATVAKIHSPTKYKIYQYESNAILEAIKKLQELLRSVDKYGSRWTDVPSNVKLSLDEEFDNLTFGAGRILLLMQELAQPQQNGFLQ